MNGNDDGATEKNVEFILSRDKVKRSQFALLLSTLIKHFPLYNMDCQTEVCLQLSTRRRLIQFSAFGAFTLLLPAANHFIALFVSHFFLFRSLDIFSIIVVVYFYLHVSILAPISIRRDE